MTPGDKYFIGHYNIKACPKVGYARKYNILNMLPVMLMVILVSI